MGYLSLEDSYRNLLQPSEAVHIEVPVFLPDALMLSVMVSDFSLKTHEGAGKPSRNDAKEPILLAVLP